MAFDVVDCHKNRNTLSPPQNISAGFGNFMRLSFTGLEPSSRSSSQQDRTCGLVLL